MNSNEKELILFGYSLAIDALNSKEADAIHEMYASGFAEWLEFRKPKLVEAIEKTNKNAGLESISSISQKVYQDIVARRYLRPKIEN